MIFESLLITRFYTKKYSLNVFSIYLFYDDGAKRQIICVLCIILGPLNYWQFFWYLHKTVKQTHTQKINQKNPCDVISSLTIMLELFLWIHFTSPFCPSHIINFEIISFDRNQSMTKYEHDVCIYR